MSHILRRSLASLHAGPSTLPPSLSSVQSTLPIAVRRRRLEYPPHPASSPSPLSDPALLDPEHDTRSGSIPRIKTPKKLPVKLEEEFQHLRSRGQYKGDEASGRRAFLLGQVAWRSRVRGFRQKKMDFLRDLEAKPALAPQAALEGGLTPEANIDSRIEQVDELDASEESAATDQAEEGSQHPRDIDANSSTVTPQAPALVAQRIYLPNIQIRLMRNHTPPGEAYDPYIATFRIPRSMTRTDLRSYLSAVYALPVTFIRTALYNPEIKRDANRQMKPQSGSRHSYKRAVVGLLEPFHYPDDVEELYAQGRESGVGDRYGDERKAWLDENFTITRLADYRKRALFKLYKGYRWRGKTQDNEGNTIREIMRRRKEQEEALRLEAGKLSLQTA